MTTMFKLFFGTIAEFEVIKTSDKSIWFKRKTRAGDLFDVRELLKTNYYEWFLTREDAIDKLYENLSAEVSSAKYKLLTAENALQKATQEFG